MNGYPVTSIINGTEKSSPMKNEKLGITSNPPFGVKLHRIINSDVRQRLGEILTRVTTVPSCNLSFLGVSSYPKIRGRTMRHAAQ